MCTVTIAITEDTGQFTLPDDAQGVPTIASFRDDMAAAARTDAKPLRQIDGELGLASG